MEVEEAWGEGKRESQLGSPPLPALGAGGTGAIQGRAWEQWKATLGHAGCHQGTYKCLLHALASSCCLFSCKG